MLLTKSKFRFKKLHKPISIPNSALPALGQIYPYELFGYKDLAQAAQDFFAKKFPSHKPYHQVVGLTNHNGKGRQWGVILFRYSDNYDWEVVAEFNHRTGGLWLRIHFVRWLSRYVRNRHRAFDRPHTLGAFVPAG